MKGTNTRSWRPLNGSGGRVGGVIIEAVVGGSLWLTSMLTYDLGYAVKGIGEDKLSVLRLWAPSAGGGSLLPSSAVIPRKNLL